LRSLQITEDDARARWQRGAIAWAPGMYEGDRRTLEGEVFRLSGGCTMKKLVKTSKHFFVEPGVEAYLSDRYGIAFCFGRREEIRRLA
jgi:hypothetical protein